MYREFELHWLADPAPNGARPIFGGGRGLFAHDTLAATLRFEEFLWSIARGEIVFNTTPIKIKGVAGLNDVLGMDIIPGFCGTCHDTPNAGNHSVKLVLLADLNQARVPLPGENVNGTLNDRRPYQGFGTISTVLPAGFSTYHSLQVKVEHRASRSLNLLNASARTYRLIWRPSFDG